MDTLNAEPASKLLALRSVHSSADSYLDDLDFVEKSVCSQVKVMEKNVASLSSFVLEDPRNSILALDMDQLSGVWLPHRSQFHFLNNFRIKARFVLHLRVTMLLELKFCFCRVCRKLFKGGD